MKESASYAKDTNPQHQSIVKEFRDAIAARNPAFVLDAVTPPGTRADLRAAAAIARGIAGHKIIFTRQPNGRVFNGSAATDRNATYVLIDVDSTRPVICTALCWTGCWTRSPTARIGARARPWRRSGA